MWHLTYLLLILSGFALTLVSTKILRGLAQKWNYVDHPAERKFHKKPTPLLGGVGIFIGFWAVIAAALFVLKFLPCLIPDDIKIYAAGVWMRFPWLFVIFIGGFVVSAVGLWDDKYVMGPKQKLLFQFIVALITVSAGIRVKIFLPDYLSYAVSIIWILAITNAFNLLDNMDGVSSGIALVCSLLLFLAAILMKNYFIALMLAVFMGALAGFLYFNFPPASIFMGDCGSNFIGYIISIITIMGTYYKSESPTLFPVVIPLLIMAVPLFDIISVMCIRVYRGKSIFNADKNHFSHRLVNMGMSIKAAVGFLYLLTFCVGLPGLLLPFLPLIGVITIFLQAVGIMGVIALLEYYGGRKD